LGPCTPRGHIFSFTSLGRGQGGKILGPNSNFTPGAFAHFGAQCLGAFAHFGAYGKKAKPVGPNSKFYSGGFCPFLGHAEPLNTHFLILGPWALSIYRLWIGRYNILHWFLFISWSSFVQSINMRSLHPICYILLSTASPTTIDFFFLFFKYVLTLNSPLLQHHLAAQVYLPPFWNRLARSLLWNRVYSIVEFNIIDSTLWINLGDPCKCSLSACAMTIYPLSLSFRKPDIWRPYWLWYECILFGSLEEFTATDSCCVSRLNFVSAKSRPLQQGPGFSIGNVLGKGSAIRS
jgi:hypothetical protein